MKRIWIPQAIAIAMLLWALKPANPYAYYILLRWVCCAIFAFLALQAHQQKQTGWVWILGVIAAIYNPFFPLQLPRDIWTFVNIATIAIAARSVFILKTMSAAETIRRFRLAAEQGNPAAQYELGILYALGQGLPKNDEKAVHWYRKAARQGHTAARRCLVEKYVAGSALLADDAESQYYLGRMHAEGSSATGKMDHAEAARWYRKAAEQNFAEAQLALGNLCASGCGVTQENNEAICWWRRAAKQGHAEALANLAFTYARLIHADVDCEAALWITKAAEENNADVQHSLGLMYAKGSGVAKNLVFAYKWLNIAAINCVSARSDLDLLQQEMTPEQIRKAQRLSESDCRVRHDVEVLHACHQAATNGDPDAQFNLGVMHEKGRGIPKDEAEAFCWWRKAAEQGHAEAQYNLACSGQGHGTGIPRYAVEAVKWFSLAAEQGHPRAQFRLGRVYAEGFDTPRNPVLAHKWLTLANRSFTRGTEIGWMEITRSARDSLRQEMTPEQIAESERLCREWIEGRNL